VITTVLHVASMVGAAARARRPAARGRRSPERAVRKGESEAALVQAARE
jgi:hypothetical protein